MSTIIVNNNKKTLKELESICNNATYIELVGVFSDVDVAYDYVKHNPVSVAIMDIETPRISGVSFAKQLLKINANMVIVYTANNEELLHDLQIDHQFILYRPYHINEIDNTIHRAKILLGHLKKDIIVRTFGYFDILLFDEPVLFRDEKAKELLAILVERRGGVLSSKAAFNLLFPKCEFDKRAEEKYSKIEKTLFEDLKKKNIDALVGVTDQGLFFRTKLCDCDLYKYLDGDMKTAFRFYGEYMVGYDWGNKMQVSLLQQQSLVQKYNVDAKSNSLYANIRCLFNEELTLIYMNDSFLAITGYTREEISELFDNSLRAMIVEEDYIKAINIVKEQLKKSHFKEIEYRLITKSGEEIWIMDKGRWIPGADTKDNGEFDCVLFDVSLTKANRQDVYLMAKKDPLTGLMDRQTAQIKIQEYIDSGDGKIGALIILDIDNFKSINDKYGHPFGDEIIKDTAKAMSKSFRQTDIVSRLGGDELIVFAKDLKDPSQAQLILQKAVDDLVYYFARANKPLSITCSFGMAVYPNDADNFEDLYSKADIALYEAKKEKGIAYNYSEIRLQALDALRVREETKGTNLNLADIEIDKMQDYFEGRLVNANDLESEINKLLGEVGEKFNISRAYVFENCKDNKTIANTFEWCAEGVSSQKEMLGNLSKETLKAYYQELENTSGLFYCYDVSRLSKELYDILAPQDIKSMLHYQLKYNGKEIGFVGFDECLKRHYWTAQQVIVLSRFGQALERQLGKYREKKVI